jgi:hypothetical protein
MPTMPTVADLLEQLATIAGSHPTIAIGWHIAMLVAVVWFVLETPTTERATVLAIAPIVSVFLVSAGHASWFNAISFGVLAIALLASRKNLAPRWRSDVPAWSSSGGVAMILFGAWYPHFTDAPWYQALVTSPVGLLPCPTLAVVAGFTLLAGGFGSRWIPALLAVWTLFYGAFGALRLGVVLDLGLLVAAIGLLGLTVHNTRAHGLTPSTSIP